MTVMTTAQEKTIAAIDAHLFNDRVHRRQYQKARAEVEMLAGGYAMYSVDTRYGADGHFLLDETYTVVIGPRGGMRQMMGRGFTRVCHPFQLMSNEQIARRSVESRRKAG